MVCFFCIAVLTLVAGAIAAGSLDRIEEQLEEQATEGVRRVSDTESVARFELTVDVDGERAPVAVTVYKEHARVRIQVLTHELTPEQIRRLQDQLAEALEAEVVDRSAPDPADHEEHRDEEESPEAEQERVSSRPQRQPTDRQPEAR